MSALFTGKKAHRRAMYDDLAATITGFGGVKVLPRKSVVGFATGHQLAMPAPGTPERFDIGLKLPGVPPEGRLETAGNWNAMMTHRVRITDPQRADEGLRGWLALAHGMSVS